MQILESLFKGVVHAPQTKMLEGGTKDEIRMFELFFFKGSLTKSSTPALAK